MTRPRRLVVVAGTGTEVGKTWVARELVVHLVAHGLRVAARKPAQSFSPEDTATDADVLAKATGEFAHDVCPEHRWYPVPMAPFMAADALGRPPFHLTDLMAEITWSRDLDVGLVEPAGGVRSPMTHDGADTVDLVRMLEPDRVVLVADAGLGTINAVRLCLDALDPAPVIVMLNRFDERDDLHARNCQWLTTNVDAPVVTNSRSLAALLAL